MSSAERRIFDRRTIDSIFAEVEGGPAPTTFERLNSKDFYRGQKTGTVKPLEQAAPTGMLRLATTETSPGVPAAEVELDKGMPVTAEFPDRTAVEWVILGSQIVNGQELVVLLDKRMSRVQVDTNVLIDQVLQGRSRFHTATVLVEKEKLVKYLRETKQIES